MRVYEWKKGSASARVTLNKTEMDMLEEDFDDLDVGQQAPTYVLRRRKQ